MKPTWSSQANERGQTVVLAAVVLAVALVPIIAAYLQLGYGGETPAGIDDPQRDAHRLLERTVQEETHDIPATYSWSERRDAAERVRVRLAPTVEQIRRGSLPDGVTHRLRYNESRGVRWAAERCPRGPNRQFGPCESIDGIVVQERGDRTHVLAVAVDLSTTTPDGDYNLTTVVRP
ncbi:DUF7261 family protein [Halovenus carboxidivorans]|uniref:DUF7261 family protein n=1 Tax=Halovenus carboxidivorans TaxID=2692199 RepID=UPI001F34C96A|nr:hypothetical protein [Halovenus carboxidivorans]